MVRLRNTLKRVNKAIHIKESTLRKVDMRIEHSNNTGDNCNTTHARECTTVH